MDAGHSMTSAVFLLSVLGGAGWVLYTLFENLNDSAKGLTLEESIARKNPKRHVPMRLPSNVLKSPAPFQSATIGRAASDTLKPDNNILHLHAKDATASNRDEKVATADEPYRFYPRIVYQCPFAIEAHKNKKIG